MWATYIDRGFTPLDHDIQSFLRCSVVYPDDVLLKNFVHTGIGLQRTDVALVAKSYGPLASVRGIPSSATEIDEHSIERLSYDRAREGVVVIC